MERRRIGRTPHFAELTLDREVAPGSLVATSVTGYENGRLTGAALS
jgi:hypothetical protein